MGPLAGGFPEVVLHPRGRDLWYASYLQTYIERDVRSITSVRDLAVFRRFLALVASRHGQMLNRTDLAAPLGVSVPTISEWLHILEITGQIVLVPPYFENFGKRLVKSPKVYWGDAGLACHLLGIQSQGELERSPFLGSIFEGFVATEILKAQVNRGHRKELYYFRDQQGSGDRLPGATAECPVLGGRSQGVEDPATGDGETAPVVGARSGQARGEAHRGASFGAHADAAAGA